MYHQWQFDGGLIQMWTSGYHFASFSPKSCVKRLGQDVNKLFLDLRVKMNVLKEKIIPYPSFIEILLVLVALYHIIFLPFPFLFFLFLIHDNISSHNTALKPFLSILELHRAGRNPADDHLQCITLFWIWFPIPCFACFWSWLLF